MNVRARVLILSGLLLAFAVGVVSAQNGNYRLGEVLGLRYFTLTNGDPSTYAQRVLDTTYPFYDQHAPGVDWVLLRGDRGRREGAFAYFFNFETLEWRDHYFPRMETLGEPWLRFAAHWDREIGEEVFGAFELAEEWMGDYVLVGPETVQDMPWVSLLGFHHIQVTLGKEDAFERFVRDRWNPKSHRPGWWILIYKTDRGPRREYLLVYAFEQTLLRDAYFPSPGEMSEEGRRALQPLDPLWAEMNSYLDAPLSEVEWTDFEIVRRAEDVAAAAVGMSTSEIPTEERAPPAVPPAEGGAPSAAPTAHASAVPVAPTIDGDVLGDSVWAGVEPIKGMWQTTPDEGRPATEDTEVRVLYTPSTLYIGVICYDRDPSQIIIADSRRDADLDEMDSFRFILDTYRDRQNGFMFGTNPSGVEYDAQVSNEGQGGGFGRGPRGGGGGLNVNWDGSWTVRAQTGDFGWSAEFAIPFRTLRFSGLGTQEWGLNFERTIRRKRERAYWSPLPRQYELARVSLAGSLTGLDIPTPRNLQLMPYVLGYGAREAGRDDYVRVGPEADFGLDLKYSITPSLTLDATYNTDFAQVEVDEQQVNLNRFNLFFPEKRPFFLENAGVFTVGQPGQVELFFSRRIGIGAGGAAVPILAGARVSGDAAGLKVGFLNMQTEQVGQAGIPGNNFGVARVKRELPNRSFVGGLFTNRQGVGDHAVGDDHNRLIALDGQIGIGRYGTVSGFVARSFTPGRTGDQHAFRLQSGYNSERWTFDAGYAEIANDFNPEVGFLRRSAYRSVDGAVMYRYRPTILGIHEWRPSIRYSGYWGFDGLYETGSFFGGSRLEWRRGYSLSTYLSLTHEGVREPFRLLGRIEVPDGSYEHREFILFSGTDQSKPISLGLRAGYGGFFGGDRISLSPTLRVRAGDKLSSAFEWSRNDVDLPGGSFTTNLIQARLSYSFTPRIFVQALVQYNDSAELWSTNLRLGWLQTAGTGLFVVFNQSSAFDEALRPGVDSQTLVVKYSRLINVLD